MTTLSMPGVENKTRAPSRWRELDFLRGLAAVLMIANHLGVDNPELDGSPWVQAILLMGSFAPVLFFFVTGMGNGVQSVAKRGERGQGYLAKVAILLVADAFLWMGPGRLVGNDFLGFIAISLFLLESIRRLPRSGMLALCLVMIVLAIRFAVGPKLRMSLPAGGEESWLGFLLGIGHMNAFSYPPCPWLAYPLIGHAVGRLAQSRRPVFEACRISVVVIMSLAAGLAVATCLLIVARGGVLFRFGTMSIGYFMASLAAILFALVFSILAPQSPRFSAFADRLALSGVQSLAVVPIHYLYRELCNQFLGPIATGLGYLFRTCLGVLFSFALSRRVPGLASRIQTPAQRLWANVIVAFVILVSASLLVGGTVAKSQEGYLRFGSQLLLCLIFALAPTRPNSDTISDAMSGRPLSRSS